MPTINPPARKRTPPPPKLANACYGYEVVGGPRGVSMNSGYPVFSEGRKINKWPYVADSHFIGYRLSDPALGKRKVHMWKLRDGKLRYMGAAGSKDEAVSRIETAWDQAATEPAKEVQRVAVNPPVRRRAPPIVG